MTLIGSRRKSGHNKLGKQSAENVQGINMVWVQENVWVGAIAALAVISLLPTTRPPKSDFRMPDDLCDLYWWPYQGYDDFLWYHVKGSKKGSLIPEAFCSATDGMMVLKWKGRP